MRLGGAALVALPVGQVEALPFDVLEARTEAQGRAGEVGVGQAPDLVPPGIQFDDARVAVAVGERDEEAAVRQGLHGVRPAGQVLAADQAAAGIVFGEFLLAIVAHEVMSVGEFARVAHEGHPAVLHPLGEDGKAFHDLPAGIEFQQAPGLAFAHEGASVGQPLAGEHVAGSVVAQHFAPVLIELEHAGSGGEEQVAVLQELDVVAQRGLVLPDDASVAETQDLAAGVVGGIEVGGHAAQAVLIDARTEQERTVGGESADFARLRDVFFVAALHPDAAAVDQIDEAVGVDHGLGDESRIGAVHHLGVLLGGNESALDGALDEEEEHARAGGLVPVARGEGLVHDLAPHSRPGVLGGFQAAAHQAQPLQERLAARLVGGQVVEHLGPEHGEPAHPFAPDLRIGVPGLVPGVHEMTVGLAAEVRDALHLAHHLGEVLGVAHGLGVAGEEDLAHEHAVHPGLADAGRVPEHPVVEAGVFIESAPDGLRRAGVALLAGEFVEQQAGVAGNEIVQGIGPELPHVSLFVDILVDVFADVRQAGGIAAPAPEMLHREHQVAGLPGERIILFAPADLVGVGVAVDELPGGGLGPHAGARLGGEHRAGQEQQGAEEQESLHNHFGGYASRMNTQGRLPTTVGVLRHPSTVSVRMYCVGRVRSAAMQSRVAGERPCSRSASRASLR